MPFWRGRSQDVCDAATGVVHLCRRRYMFLLGSLPVLGCSSSIMLPFERNLPRRHLLIPFSAHTLGLLSLHLLVGVHLREHILPSNFLLLSGAHAESTFPSCVFFIDAARCLQHLSSFLQSLLLNLWIDASFVQSLQMQKRFSRQTSCRQVRILFVKDSVQLRLTFAQQVPSPFQIDGVTWKQPVGLALRSRPWGGKHFCDVARARGL